LTKEFKFEDKMAKEEGDNGIGTIGVGCLGKVKLGKIDPEK
jgi:hypothetical protein